MEEYTNRRNSNIKIFSLVTVIVVLVVLLILSNRRDNALPEGMYIYDQIGAITHSKRDCEYISTYKGMYKVHVTKDVGDNVCPFCFNNKMLGKISNKIAK